MNISSLAKQRGTSLRASFEGTWPNTRYLDQRLAQMVLTRERFAEYGSLCSALPRRGTPFIYVPLMFQPERTSCPQGGVFSNQFIMVNWLARLAPEGMLVCVKEHPTQLNPSMQATQARASEFYQELKTFPNVRLLSLDADPFETMDRCTAVATVAGTSAVEAVVRGRTALVFGASYYNDCVGIYPVDTEQDLASALAAIVRQPKVDRRAVEAFFYAIETALFEGNADLNLSSITAR